MKIKGKKLALFALTLGVTFFGGSTILKSKVVNAKEKKEVVGLGSDGIKSPDAGEIGEVWTGSFVWFGGYDGNPVKYRVLDPSTTIFTSQSEPTMFLDCDKILYDDNNANGGRITEKNEHENTWLNNSIRAGLNGDSFYNKTGVFTNLEKKSIASSKISEHTITIESKYTKLHPTYSALDNDHVFLLDFEDVINPAYGYNTYCDPDKDVVLMYRRKYKDNYTGELYNLSWWLRTPAIMEDHNIKYTGGCEVSSEDGDIGKTFSGYYEGVSPAFNVKLSSVLYTSLVSGEAGKDNAEYKLTLVDDNMKVSIPTDSPVDISGENIKVPYAITGTDSDMANQMAVLVLDKEYTSGNTNSAKVLYYSKTYMEGAFSKNGEAGFSLPSELVKMDWGKDYHVYLIAEQGNGAYKSDYASIPVEIKRDMVDVPYDLWIGDTQVKESNRKSIPCDSGTASFDPETNKLLLNDITKISGGKYGKIYSKIDGLIVSGNATIDDADIGIYSEKTIIFDDANLKIKGNVNAIFGREMIIKSGEINVEGKGLGIKVYGLKIEGGKVSASTDTYYYSSAIIAEEYINVSGGEVDTYSDGLECLGIRTKKFVMDGGKIGIESYGGSCKGIIVTDSFSVNDGELIVSVLDEGGYGVGIDGITNIAKMSINGGSVKVSADLDAIFMPGGITLGEKMMIAVPQNGKLSEDSKRVLKSDESGAHDVEFAVKKVSVAFDLNGKSATKPETQNLNYGDKAKEPAAPSLEGWVFDGWYTADTCKDSEKYDFSSPVKSDIVLYAKWTMVKKEETPTPSENGKDTESEKEPEKDIYGNEIVSETEKEEQIISLSSEADAAGSTYNVLQARQKKVTKNSIKISWKKVSGASAYTVYGNKCGKANKYEKLATVKGTSFAEKKLKKGTYYKYIVVAVGDGKSLATSKTLHIATLGGKVGNNKSVKIKKTKISLKKGKSSAVKASATPVSKKMKVKKHRNLSYETSDPKVATVSKKGKIKAVGKGNCLVYVYAQNGVSKAVKVKVK